MLKIKLSPFYLFIFFFNFLVNFWQFHELNILPQWIAEIMPWRGHCLCLHRGRSLCHLSTMLHFCALSSNTEFCLYRKNVPTLGWGYTQSIQKSRIFCPSALCVSVPCSLTFPSVCLKPPAQPQPDAAKWHQLPRHRFPKWDVRTGGWGWAWEWGSAPTKGKALRSHALGTRAFGHWRVNTGWAREGKYSNTGKTYCRTPEDQAAMQKKKKKT